MEKPWTMSFVFWMIESVRILGVDLISRGADGGRRGPIKISWADSAAVGRVMVGCDGVISVIPLSQHVARWNGNHRAAPCSIIELLVGDGDFGLVPADRAYIDWRHIVSTKYAIIAPLSILVALTLSSPVASNGYTSKCSGPYWSHPPFLIFLTLPECQKIKKGGLDQYGPECFGRLTFATIRKSVELNGLTPPSTACNGIEVEQKTTVISSAGWTVHKLIKGVWLCACMSGCSPRWHKS